MWLKRGLVSSTLLSASILSLSASGSSSMSSSSFDGAMEAGSTGWDLVERCNRKQKEMQGNPFPKTFDCSGQYTFVQSEPMAARLSNKGTQAERMDIKDGDYQAPDRVMTQDLGDTEVACSAHTVAEVRLVEPEVITLEHCEDFAPSNVRKLCYEKLFSRCAAEIEASISSDSISYEAKSADISSSGTSSESELGSCAVDILETYTDCEMGESASQVPMGTSSRSSSDEVAIGVGVDGSQSSSEGQHGWFTNRR